MTEPIEDAYFNWLYAKVAWHDVRSPSTSFQSLLYFLHSTEFIWLVAGDDNRAEEGIDLRKEFLQQSRYPNDSSWMALGCSVLEMLIAFARRAAFQTTSMDLKTWFWVFLENLGLSHISDGTYAQENYCIAPIIERFIFRQYDEMGRNGGMFPLDSSPNDQTQIELWYQFNEYIVDKDIY